MISTEILSFDKKKRIQTLIILNRYNIKRKIRILILSFKKVTKNTSDLDLTIL